MNVTYKNTKKGQVLSICCSGPEEFFVPLIQGNLVPVYREILADTDTPVSAAMKLGGSPSFLLESVEGGEKWARYSFLGSKTVKGDSRAGGKR